MAGKITQGRRYVVDTDLEQFFDWVNHDVLMARVARKVKDKRILWERSMMEQPGTAYNSRPSCELP